MYFLLQFENFSLPRCQFSWGLLTLGLVIKRLSAQVREPGWIGVMKFWSDLGSPILEAEKGKIPENFRKDSGEILWFGQNFVDFGIVMEMTVYFGCGPPLRIQLLPPRWFWVWKSHPKPSFATGMLGGRLPGWSKVNPKYINFRDPW